MKNTIKIVIFLFLYASHSYLSASPVILPGIIDLHRMGLSTQDDTVYVKHGYFNQSYLFAELPNSALLGIENNEKTIAEFSNQLENSNWKKFDMTSHLEFETTKNGCRLLLMLINADMATRVLASIKTLAEGIYFHLIPDEECQKEQIEYSILAQFNHSEVFSAAKLMLAKQPPEPYGTVREFSQIAEYSDTLSLKDLIDFDSHQTLSILQECHTKSLFAANLKAKIGCFVEDRSNYSSYAKLDQLKIYNKEPYISSRAGSYFRKQGFQVMLRGTRESQLTKEYDQLSYENDDLPSLQDAGFVTRIKPETCLIGAWLFEAVKTSPLWNEVAYKTIKVKAENGEIKQIKIYEKNNFLVSIAPLEGCE